MNRLVWQRASDSATRADEPADTLVRPRGVLAAHFAAHAPSKAGAGRPFGSIAGPPPGTDRIISPLAIFDKLGVAAVVTDLDGVIIAGTDAAGRLYHCDQSELAGRPLVNGSVGGSAAIASVIVRESLVTGSWHGYLDAPDDRSEDSPELGAEVRATIVVDDTGEPAAALVAFGESSDVVDEEGRAHLEARLRAAERVPGVGSWSWNPRDDQLVTSGGLITTMGLDASATLRMSDVLATMPAEDRRQTEATIAEALAAGTDSFSIEYRLRGADGKLHWLETRCETVRDRRGEAVRVYGSTRSITEQAESSERLRAIEHLWQVSIDSMSAHVAVLDHDGDILEVNEAWRRFGSAEGAESDFVGLNYVNVCLGCDEPDSDLAGEGLVAVLSGQSEHFGLEYPCHSPSRRRWFMMRVTRYGGAGVAGVVVSHEDVTERRGERERDLMHSAVLDEVDVAVHTTSLDRTVLSWSAGAERLYGWTAEEAVGKRVDDLLIPAEFPVDQRVRARISVDSWEGDLKLRRKDGSTFDAYVRTRLVADLDGNNTRIAAVTWDQSERVQSERELMLARDYLRAVTDSMAEGMYTIDLEGRLIHMNKTAQKWLGWSVDDLRGRIVHEVIHNRDANGAPRSREDSPMTLASRHGQVVRVEDDVFIRPDGSELPVAYTAAPFFTEDGIEGCVVVFQDITERKTEALRVERNLEKLVWVKHVSDALAEDRFVLYAQPIIDLASGDVVQQELLIRMLDPDDKDEVVAPFRFLPVAEEYGFIFDIDRWVIDRSAELVAGGRAVELNVSARSVSDPTLVAHITDAIARTGADPGQMVFEITETTLLEDTASARGFVEQLHAIGCKVALDDFGTGYGGFTYLKQLPIDYLKIDIEFVRDLASNAASRNVVEAIVKLARDFGIKTVAEGVEDQATLDLLRELGVDHAQGYHISRPGPIEISAPTQMSSTMEPAVRQEV